MNSYVDSTVVIKAANNTSWGSAALGDLIGPLIERIDDSIAPADEPDGEVILIFPNGEEFPLSSGIDRLMSDFTDKDGNLDLDVLDEYLSPYFKETEDQPPRICEHPVLTVRPPPKDLS